MKKQLITGLFTAMSCMYANAQTLTTAATYQDKPTELVTVLKGDKLDSDQYEIDIYLVGSEEAISGISTYDIIENVSVNGTKVYVDLWASYSETNDFGGEKSLKFSMELEDIVEVSAHLLKENGNELKIQFLNKAKANAEMCAAEIKFDIPGFKESNSEFCNKLLEFKSDDEKVNTILMTIFKAVYPHEKVEEILMSDKWRISETNGGNNTYMVVYRNKGRLLMLRYSASYVMVEGKLLGQPRVKIYNGLDDPMPLGEACFTNLKTKLK